MPNMSPDLQSAVWAVVDGRASDSDMALFDADSDAVVRILDRLIDETEEDLDAVSGLQGDEREQVVADFEDTLDGLWAVRDRLRPPPPRVEPPPKPAKN